MSKRILKLTGSLARQAACRYVNDAPEGHVVTIAEPTRSLEANALMWALLTDLSNQTNGDGQPERFRYGVRARNIYLTNAAGTEGRVLLPQFFRNRLAVGVQAEANVMPFYSFTLNRDSQGVPLATFQRPNDIEQRQNRAWRINAAFFLQDEWRVTDRQHLSIRGGGATCRHRIEVRRQTGCSAGARRRVGRARCGIGWRRTDQRSHVGSFAAFACARARVRPRCTARRSDRSEPGDSERADASPC